MVPIGASSSIAVNWSIKPSCVTRASRLSPPSSRVGPGRRRFNSAHNRWRISSAARVVKVRTTTSLGKSPCHAARSSRSANPMRSAPPDNGAGRGPAGNNRVAR